MSRHFAAPLGLTLAHVAGMDGAVLAWHVPPDTAPMEPISLQLTVSIRNSEYMDFGIASHFLL